MSAKIDLKLFQGIAGRKIINFHPEHTKQLLVILCQALGLADESGVLITPANMETGNEKDSAVPLNSTYIR